MSLADAGKLDGAIAAYWEAIRLAPNDGWARNNLGLALRAQGRDEEAFTEWREAVRVAPGHAYARNNYGTALYQRGEMDAAIAEWQTALDLDPTPERRAAQPGDSVPPARHGARGAGAVPGSASA